MRYVQVNNTAFMTSHGQFLWSSPHFYYPVLISNQNDVDRRVIPVVYLYTSRRPYYCQKGSWSATNWSGVVFQSWFLLFGPIHVIADNLARFMSADKKISNPDSNSVFRSNTIKNTWFGFFENTRRISGKFHVFWGITRLSDTSALEYSIFAGAERPMYPCLHTSFAL